MRKRYRNVSYLGEGELKYFLPRAREGEMFRTRKKSTPLIMDCPLVF